jgi:hypothetical protein
MKIDKTELVAVLVMRGCCIWPHFFVPKIEVSHFMVQGRVSSRVGYVARFRFDR